MNTASCEIFADDIQRLNCASWDAPTTNNDIMLTSLGGKPRMPADRYAGSFQTEILSTNSGSEDTNVHKAEDALSATEL